MTSKIKAMFKKQVSWSNEDSTAPSVSGAPLRMQNHDNSDAVTMRKNLRRRHRTALGLEELLKCPVCTHQLKSPKMLPCQHTFCEKCLEIKLEETSENEDKTLRCPICRSPASEPSTLPNNMSLENLLRVVESDFVETRATSSKRPTSLYANLAQAKKEKRRSMSFREAAALAVTKKCAQCETVSENTNKCGHCNQIFCKVCEPLHAKQLKQSFKPIIEQLQLAMNKLDHRFESFIEKADQQKDLIATEIEAKIAELKEEKARRLKMADESRSKAEDSANEIKQKIRESQVELAKLNDGGFDNVDDDKKV